MTTLVEIDSMSSMDLNSRITLHDETSSVSIPLINLLRITMVHIKDFLLEYKHNNQSNDVYEFYQWVMREKLDVKEGDSVLL